MNTFRAILECITGRDHSSQPQDYEYSITEPNEPKLTSFDPTEDELASSIISILFTAEKGGQDLKSRIQSEVHTTGWYEGLAKRILDGIVAALQSGAPMASAMKEAFDKASAIAVEFIKEHPILKDVIITVIAIGILAILLPWAVEALGFGELGPIEGKVDYIPLSFTSCSEFEREKGR